MALCAFISASVAGRRDDPQARQTCDRMVPMLGLTLVTKGLGHNLDGLQSRRCHGRS